MNQNWKQSSAEEWINKPWCIHTVKHSAIKRDHCSMDEPEEHHVEQKKADKGGIIHTA